MQEGKGLGALDAAVPDDAVRMETVPPLARQVEVHQAIQHVPHSAPRRWGGAGRGTGTDRDREGAAADWAWSSALERLTRSMQCTQWSISRMVRGLLRM